MSKLCPTCGQLNQEGTTLVQLMVTHNATPEDGRFPDLSDGDELRTFETDEGWILLTHGVGPMRQYWMGALLLDLDDPSRVIGELSEPMLVPNEDERDGYVPNVVYSCGALRHGDHLVIPYAVSDSQTSFARVPVADLLAELRR